jgi:hypothetical protein
MRAYATQVEILRRLRNGVCPTCKEGRLSLVEGSLVVEEPEYSKRAVTLDDWEPDWVTERFLMRLKCSREDCGEIVCVTGDTLLADKTDSEGRHHRERDLRPDAMFPAPPIIATPAGTPTEVMNALNSSFAIFWTDLGASASRLRTSLERIMDHYGVAKRRLRRDRLRNW